MDFFLTFEGKATKKNSERKREREKNSILFVSNNSIKKNRGFSSDDTMMQTFRLNFRVVVVAAAATVTAQAINS